MDEDRRLIDDYLANHSQEAFARLVQRHVNMVHATAFRAVGDYHLADDVTQAVFLLLWRNCGRLKSKTVLAGWLFKTTRNVAADAMRSRRRRNLHEMKAIVPEARETSRPDLDWERIAPELDAAIARLKPPARDAVLLRFFRGQDYEEIGLRLGISADAAKMRVSRAVEMLRGNLGRAGVGIAAPALIAGLGIYAAPAAPPAVAATAASLGAFSPAARVMAEQAWRWMFINLALGTALACAIAPSVAWVIVHHIDTPYVRYVVSPALVNSPSPLQTAAADPAATPSKGPAYGFVYEACVDPALVDQIRAAGIPSRFGGWGVNIERAKLAAILLSNTANQVRSLSTTAEVLPRPPGSLTGAVISVTLRQRQDVLVAGTRTPVRMTMTSQIQLPQAPGGPTGFNVSYNIQAEKIVGPGAMRMGSGGWSVDGTENSIVYIAAQLGWNADAFCPLVIFEVGRPLPTGSIHDWLAAQK